MERKNDPMMPVAWTNEYKTATAKTARVFTTTMGSSQDFLNENFRRLVVNACYWGLRMEEKISTKTQADLVGKYKPMPFGFGMFKKGQRPIDFLPRSAKP